jgi:hypothetical protein
MFKNIRKISNYKYMYLEHSFRVGKKVRKISFYLQKEESFNISKFTQLNDIKTTQIAKERIEHIKKTQKIEYFYKFGDYLLEIEKGRVLFQLFYNLLNEKEKEKILDEYLRKFLVNSMNMEGGTISYKIAKAIDETELSELGSKIPNLGDRGLFLLTEIKSMVNLISSV